MRPTHNAPHPTDRLGLPEGLLAAVICAGLMIGSFAITTAYTTMPPGERWAALTAFSLLAAAYTLPGSAALYDTLGRAVRRDWRAMASLSALVPALYLAYSAAVGELSPLGVISACLFAGLPAVAFGLSRRSRQPTLFDAVALIYLTASLWLGLLPGLTLPQQGGLVGFFALAAAPLLLLLFAQRGWPGVGFTWHLSGRELRDALLAAAPAIAILAAIAALSGGLQLATPTAGSLLGAAVGAYFFTALPAELLLRGGLQNGIAQALRGRMDSAAGWAALGAVAALTAPISLARGGGPYSLIADVLISLAAGWAYLRTGKVTASAVTHMFVALTLALLTTP